MRTAIEVIVVLAAIAGIIGGSFTLISPKKREYMSISEFETHCEKQNKQAKFYIRNKSLDLRYMKCI